MAGLMLSLERDQETLSTAGQSSPSIRVAMRASLLHGLQAIGSRLLLDDAVRSRKDTRVCRAGWQPMICVSPDPESLCSQLSQPCRMLAFITFGRPWGIGPSCQPHVSTGNGRGNEWPWARRMQSGSLTLLCLYGGCSHGVVGFFVHQQAQPGGSRSATKPRRLNQPHFALSRTTDTSNPTNLRIAPPEPPCLPSMQVMGSLPGINFSHCRWRRRLPTSSTHSAAKLSKACFHRAQL